MVWTFSENLHSQATIEALAQRFAAALRELVNHCLSVAAGGRTPSDYPLARLAQHTVDRLVGGGRGVEDIYPLSPVQQGMLFHALRDKESGVYVQQMTFRVEAGLQPAAFLAAWQQILARHAILRTAFHWEEVDEPLQIVQTHAQLSLAEYDLRGVAACDQRERLSAFLHRDRVRGFDLAAPPLMRLSLFRLDEHAYHVVWTFHHLLLDGWSLPVLFTELFALYEAARLGKTVRLPCPRPFRDYIAWQQKQDRAQAEAFWRAALQGFTTPTPLSVASVHPTQESLQLATRKECLPTATTDALDRFARAHGVTASTVLQAAFGLLLSRYSGEQDVVFGTTQSGRSAGPPGMERMLGIFINTLPVRVRLHPESTGAALLHGLQTAQAAQLPHAFAPLREVQGWSEVPRGQPLFEALLVIENYPVDESLRQDALPFAIRDVRMLEQTNYPLTLTALLGRDLSLRLSYDTGRFDEATARRMLGHYQTLLLDLMARPEHLVSTLEMLTAAERQQLLVEWNATKAEYPHDRCIHSLFEAQAELTPDALAVVFEQEQLSYRQLNARANQLAHALRGLGVGPEVLVGICMERSLEMVVGLLGILKAGGAYVPLDPSYPKSRLAFMLQDSEIGLLLTQGRLLARLPECPAKALCLDTEWPTLASDHTDDPTSVAGPENLAYVIYTSGSTGQPKGTLVPHRGLVNYLSFASQTYDVAGGTGAPVHSSLGFDLTVTALWAPLLVGRAVVLLQEQPGIDALAQLLEQRNELSLIKVTPSHLALLEQVLPAAAAGHARAVVIGGEALSWEQLQFFRSAAPRTRLFNEYGPTETSVGCCVYEAPADGPAGGPVPVGRPIANTQLYVLDGALRPVPIGIVGELYIGGAGVARGYLRRPELTAERFIESPFEQDAAARLYRSGDLCRWRADGNLEFIGRVDQQVKLRGHRIELGEIESALMEHPTVREAVVLAREDAPGDKRLVAYLLTREAVPPSASELRSYLLQKLPDYMVPALYVHMQSLPLTANGKVDRRALPVPTGGLPESASSNERARTQEEAGLARIWSRLLRIPNIGRDSNFFELGGDSILAIQVIGQARQAGLNVSLRQLFRHPTIAELAHVATTDRRDDVDQGPVTGPVDLTPIQHWFFELRLEEPHRFNQAILLETTERLQLAALQRAVRQLVAHHDALRLRFHREGSVVSQVNAAADDAVTAQVIDLSAVPAAEQRDAIESAAAAVQASLHLESGPLMRVVWLDLGPLRNGRLLIVIHHLAVDGVSWRIIVEDLETAYGQACRNEPPQLPRKTTSFRQWAAQLQRYAQSDAVQQELPYWRSLSPAVAVPTDTLGGANTVGSACVVEVRLEAKETRMLLQELPALYQTEVSDALLTALLAALSPWVGSRKLRVDLEHHGRHEIVPNLDVSRTVGWFTAVFPAVLELPEAPLSDALLSIQKQRRQIPRDGLGYGLLRFLQEDASIDAALATANQADVSFNYLGQLDASLIHSRCFGVAGESIGPTQSPRALRTHRLEINAWVLADSLQVQWVYSENLHRRATIETLAERFLAALRTLTLRCQAGPCRELPTDG
jgi:amino acid adenylation domain-containing protein/non-ribosomal peptide synthase protein (TIGR01720 family)